MQRWHPWVLQSLVCSFYFLVGIVGLQIIDDTQMIYLIEFAGQTASLHHSAFADGAALGREFEGFDWISDLFELPFFGDNCIIVLQRK